MGLPSIPIELKDDELVWNNPSSGSLSLKGAYYAHPSPTGQHLHWTFFGISLFLLPYLYWFED
jgi:hypothetical protein